MPFDSYRRKVEDAPLQGKGEAYTGPPAPSAFFVVDANGRGFWAQKVSEEGMGRRVQVVREVEGWV